MDRASQGKGMVSCFACSLKDGAAFLRSIIVRKGLAQVACAFQGPCALAGHNIQHYQYPVAAHGLACQSSVILRISHLVRAFMLTPHASHQALGAVMQVVFSWHSFSVQLLPDPAANKEGPSLDILQVTTQAFVMRC